MCDKKSLQNFGSTSTDMLWSKFADENLSPDATLASSAAAGKYILATSILMTTAFSTFGLASPAIRDESVRYAMTISCIVSAFCVALALFYLFPRARHITPGNTLEVEDWFLAQTRRGWSLALSAVLLTLQGLCAPVAIVLDTLHHEAPRTQISFSPNKQDKAGLSEAAFSFACNSCEAHEFSAELVSHNESTGADTSLFTVKFVSDDAGDASYTSQTIKFSRESQLILRVNGSNMSSIETR